jgi:cyclic pyranopterin phosphate synthase
LTASLLNYSWTVELMVEFSHIKNDRAQMVDVTAKDDVEREAVASGKIFLRAGTLQAIREGTVVKGNVLATARVAATVAIKDTFRLIPMCHPIPISAISVDFSEPDGCIEATVRVKSTGKTGVEMEALTGVSVALLTIWDMVKSAEKDTDGQYPATRISDIRVLEKHKGR